MFSFSNQFTNRLCYRSFSRQNIDQTHRIRNAPWKSRTWKIQRPKILWHTEFATQPLSDLRLLQCQKQRILPHMLSLFDGRHHQTAIAARKWIEGFHQKPIVFGQKEPLYTESERVARSAFKPQRYVRYPHPIIVVLPTEQKKTISQYQRTKQNQPMGIASINHIRISAICAHVLASHSVDRRDEHAFV